MEVRFTKSEKGRTCSWEALRPPRTKVPGPAMAAGADLPHDLATFVIEEALGIERGFWGSVAEGATFRSLGRKRTEPGKRVIARNIDELDAAEAQVNAVYAAWRRGEPTPADEALDTALRAWRNLPRGDEMVLEWPNPTRRRQSARRR